MRIRILTAALLIIVAGRPLGAQPVSTERADSTELRAIASLRSASALPAALTPPPHQAAADVAALEAQDEGLPLLLGVFGGIAGMFVGKWALSRGCEENCSEEALLGGMAGILVGGIIGYLVGGGEMPDEPPGRWP
ncbi:MAG TPA: hypothetical protein VFY65_11115 [Longimicrobium sp.]|nr:hypothetical protein [Longimicrobium sp.]